MYWIKSLLNLNHKSFATHWWELPQRFCHDKCTFVMTKHVFCHDKNMLVATNILVMTKLLSWQTHVCHNKTHLLLRESRLVAAKHVGFLLLLFCFLLPGVKHRAHQFPCLSDIKHVHQLHTVFWSPSDIKHVHQLPVHISSWMSLGVKHKYHQFSNLFDIKHGHQLHIILFLIFL